VLTASVTRSSAVAVIADRTAYHVRYIVKLSNNEIDEINSYYTNGSK